MNLRARIQAWIHGADKPLHLRHGELGERAAGDISRRRGLKFLTANFRSKRGEIDLVFRDGDCLVFVEVKTRSSEDWTRPAAAVDARGAKIGRQEFKAKLLQVPFRRAFAEFASPQMLRLFLAREPSFDFFKQVHP